MRFKETVEGYKGWGRGTRRKVEKRRETNNKSCSALLKNISKAVKPIRLLRKEIGKVRLWIWKNCHLDLCTQLIPVQSPEYMKPWALLRMIP